MMRITKQVHDWDHLHVEIILEAPTCISIRDCVRKLTSGSWAAAAVIENISQAARRCVELLDNAPPADDYISNTCCSNLLSFDNQRSSARAA